MIKATECRVGNKLYFQFAPDQARKTVTVSWVSDDSLGYREQHEASYPQSPKSFAGIPLTEEWLVNLGFVKSPHDSIGDFELEMPENNELEYGRSDRAITFNGMYLPKQPEFVHQLQNIFFALTGEELTIKEPA
jgi:hypothetical protein